MFFSLILLKGFSVFSQCSEISQWCLCSSIVLAALDWAFKIIENHVLYLWTIFPSYFLNDFFPFIFSLALLETLPLGWWIPLAGSLTFQSSHSYFSSVCLTAFLSGRSPHLYCSKLSTEISCLLLDF